MLTTPTGNLSIKSPTFNCPLVIIEGTETTASTSSQKGNAWVCSLARPAGPLRWRSKGLLPHLDFRELSLGIVVCSKTLQVLSPAA